MNVLLFAIATLLIALVVKIWLDPNRIKPMSNEQIRDERIKRGMSANFKESSMGNESTNLDAVIYLPSYLFIKHNPRNNRATKRKGK